MSKGIRKLNLESLTTDSLYELKNKYFDETRKISKRYGEMTLKELETISFYNEICEELFKRGEIE